jgi:hypothetical protein
MLQFSFLLAALSVVLVELVGGLLRDELDEVGDLSAAVVGDGLLCVLRQPEDCGESPDIETWRSFIYLIFFLCHTTLANLFSLVKCLWVRSGAYTRGKRLKGSPLG